MKLRPSKHMKPSEEPASPHDYGITSVIDGDIHQNQKRKEQ